MKKILFKALTICSLVISATVLSNAANDPFEGMIRYKLQVTGDNAEMFSAFMPNAMEMYMKGSNSIVKTIGGMAAMTGDILTRGNEKLVYMLMHSKTTAYKINTTDEKSDKEADMKIEKLNGEEVVNGYKCKIYNVTISSAEGANITQKMWCTTDIQITPPVSSSKTSTGNFFIKGIEGFPVKIEQMMDVQGMKINQTITLDKLEKMNLDEKMFEVPSNYKVKDFDPKEFGMGN